MSPSPGEPLSAGVAPIALVYAAAENGVIGRGGRLPWHLPDDLRHFKSVTLGKPILMGRRTLDSIGRALPGRRNLVLSRSGGAAAGVEFVHSIDEARRRSLGASELCVIGGAEVFALTQTLASRLYWTQVHASIAGDAFFVLPDPQAWQEVQRIEHPADAHHAYAMSFVTLERRA